MSSRWVVRPGFQLAWIGISFAAVYIGGQFWYKRHQRRNPWFGTIEENQKGMKENYSFPGNAYSKDYSSHVYENIGSKWSVANKEKEEVVEFNNRVKEWSDEYNAAMAEHEQK